MIAWFWPEIERNLLLLDMVLTARVYNNKSEHCKQLERGWLCLNTLAQPFAAEIARFYRWLL